MNAPDLILASTSRYRAEQLARLGVPFRQAAPTCDEEALKREFLASNVDLADRPRALAQFLARAKALSVAAGAPHAVVIGADQLACLDSDILGKPGDPERAAATLARMAGRTHRLVTAVCVVAAGREHPFCDVTALTMRRLCAAAIARYIAADNPIDCAGAYKLERRGIALFSRIDSADQTAITGLPLIALADVLATLGFDLP